MSNADIIHAYADDAIGFLDTLLNHTEWYRPYVENCRSEMGEAFPNIDYSQSMDYMIAMWEKRKYLINKSRHSMLSEIDEKE